MTLCGMCAGVGKVEGKGEKGGEEVDASGHVLLLSQGAESVPLNMLTFWREPETPKKD